MAKILFTESRVVKDAEGRIKHSFEKGKVYDLADSSANWWKLQGCAVDAPAEPPAMKTSGGGKGGAAASSPKGDGAPQSEKPGPA